MGITMSESQSLHKLKLKSEERRKEKYESIRKIKTQ
jgi:hypothetical protein